MRDRKKHLDEELDILEDSAFTKVRAHLSRRAERKTKDKWVRLASDYATEIAFSGPKEKEAMRDYLKLCSEAVQEMDVKAKRRRGEKAWVRTEKLIFEEK